MAKDGQPVKRVMGMRCATVEQNAAGKQREMAVHVD
jgi:hypothetical protein